MTESLSEYAADYSMPELKGHQHLLDRIFTGVSQGSLHHAWLISGPEGIGKFKAALHIAAWLLSLPKFSEESLFNDAGYLCLENPDELCFNQQDSRLAINQTHPDLLILEPTEDDKNKSGLIKTSQIRELNSFFAHSAGRDGWRVAIINSLDLVNRNGQNAMLKILEEPPQRSILLVLSHQQSGILPTVRSRCMYVAMNRLNILDTQSILKHIWPDSDENHIALLAKLCDGAPGQALRLEKAGALPLFEESCNLLADKTTGAHDLWSIAEKWGPGGNKGRTVRMAALYLFEKLISRASLSAVGCLGYENDFDTIPFTKNALEALASRHYAYTLSNVHQSFCTEIRQAERLFLDFTPVFAKFLCKLRSQTRTE
tara:strand:+ start:108 stop:1223 length:1116 start_codon:yes stop_codon:yes gene_type:complete